MRTERGRQKAHKLPVDTIIKGDCRNVLKTFPDSSVDLVVTSPPYADSRKHTLGRMFRIGLDETRFTRRTFYTWQPNAATVTTVLPFPSRCLPGSSNCSPNLEM